MWISIVDIHRGYPRYPYPKMTMDIHAIHAYPCCPKWQNPRCMYRVGSSFSDLLYNIGTFLSACIMWSGDSVIGSNVLKNTNATLVCVETFSWWPVRHKLHEKKSSGWAYHKSPSPVISKSCKTSKSSVDLTLNGYGALRHTQSCTPCTYSYFTDIT